MVFYPSGCPVPNTITTYIVWDSSLIYSFHIYPPLYEVLFTYFRYKQWGHVYGKASLMRICRHQKR